MFFDYDGIFLLDLLATADFHVFKNRNPNQTTGNEITVTKGVLSCALKEIYFMKFL